MFSHRRRYHGLKQSLLACLLIIGSVTACILLQEYRQAKLLASEKQLLTKIIRSYTPIQSSIAVINIQTGKIFNVGSNQSFVGASTTKIILAACLLHEVEIGKKNLSIQLGTYPASFQLQQMIQQSNNDAWHELTGYVGLNTLKDYVHTIGIQYNISQNSITTQNEALFLQKLYTEKLLNSQDTQLILSYMQNTNEDDLIAAWVPDNVKIYHKYGWLNNYIHDAAILVYNKTPVILVIYTKGNTTTANQQIQLFKPITTSILKYEFGLS